ncbi:hypothetical protein C8J57DRAFT_1649966 [Mycena rebaudengoi]|nr:hypothetical protein C8J57DRAFT_1649966 [Mycena rebaudengoi]
MAVLHKDAHTDASRAPLLTSADVQYKLSPLTGRDEHSYRLPSPPRNPRISSFARKPAWRNCMYFTPAAGLPIHPRLLHRFALLSRRFRSASIHPPWTFPSDFLPLRSRSPTTSLADSLTALAVSPSPYTLRAARCSPRGGGGTQLRWCYGGSCGRGLAVLARQQAVLLRWVDATLVRRRTRARDAMRAVLSFVTEAAIRRALAVPYRASTLARRSLDL